jgi:hypothetical protein
MGDFTKSSLAFHVCKIIEDDKFASAILKLDSCFQKSMGSKYANCDFLLRICVGKINILLEMTHLSVKPKDNFMFQNIFSI